MNHPTAAELHATLQNPNPPAPRSYEGGFTTDDRGIHFIVRTDGDGTVDFHATVSSQGFGSASVYHRLEPSEAKELAGALVLAAEAAERAQAAA